MIFYIGFILTVLFFIHVLDEKQKTVIAIVASSCVLVFITFFSPLFADRIAIGFKRIELENVMRYENNYMITSRNKNGTSNTVLFIDYGDVVKDKENFISYEIIKLKSNLWLNPSYILSNGHETTSSNGILHTRLK